MLENNGNMFYNVCKKRVIRMERKENVLAKNSKTKKLILYGLLALYIFMNFWNLLISPLSKLGKIEESISLMFTIVSIFIFIISITQLNNVLYFSDDVEKILLVSSKPKKIFFNKLLDVYFFDLVITCISLLPGIILCGVKMNESIVYYIYSTIILLGIPVIPILIVTIISTVLAQIFKVGKYKKLLKPIATILLLGMIIIFETNLNFNMKNNGEYSGEYVLNMCENLKEKMPYYLKVSVNAIDRSCNISGFLSILWFIIINAIDIFLVITFFYKIYFKGVYNNSKK